jgi:peptide/nickel transport system permease protein
MAILLIIIFAVEINRLLAMHIRFTAGETSSWDLAQHMILTTVAFTLIPMGVIIRVACSSVLEILSREFVMTLRAKGLRSRTITRHIVKNAAPPVRTLMGLQFGYLLGGSVLVVTVLSWPESGFLLKLSIFQLDIPMLQKVTPLLAAYL